jgi:hypothetical protein
MTDVASTLAHSAKHPRPDHGPIYSQVEFGERYGLDEAESIRLYDKFGPHARDLDILMRAKGMSPRVKI